MKGLLSQRQQISTVYQHSRFQGSEITPNLSLLSDVLYESEFESQLWMLYNSNKQFVACGDAYPSRWSIKVTFLRQRMIHLGQGFRTGGGADIILTPLQPLSDRALENKALIIAIG